jgi:outer membrane biosynthesis protein TonB
MFFKTPAILFGVSTLFFNLTIYTPANATENTPEPTETNITAPVTIPPAPQTLNATTTPTKQATENQLVSATTPTPVVVAEPAKTTETKQKNNSTDTKQTTQNSNTSAPAVTASPGSAQDIAQQMLTAQGLGQSEFNCLVALWNKESGWKVNAENKSSGAYGIPQALPGKKMASAGADWQTNPATQISWGLQYIMGRYGTPCGAWAKSQSSGWY